MLVALPTVVVTLPRAVVAVPTAVVAALPTAVVALPTALVALPTAPLTFAGTGAFTRRTGIAPVDGSDSRWEALWDPGCLDPAHEGFPDPPRTVVPDPAEPRCVDPAFPDAPEADAPREGTGSDRTRAGPPLHRYPPALAYAAPGSD